MPYIRALYNALPKSIAKRLRGVLEFDGGATDTYIHAAAPGVDSWNIIHEGKNTPRYRPQPGSTPSPAVPSGPPARTFNTQYYTRDATRNPAARAPLGLSAAAAAALGAPAPAVAPAAGSPGMRNPDVLRYDASGSRSAMTATWAATAAALQRARPTHLARPARTGLLRQTRGWAMTHGAPGEC